MNKSDIAYISSGLIEVYKQTSGHEIYYVPVVSSDKSVFGQMNITYDEESKLRIYGTFTFQQNQGTDVDLIVDEDSRINGYIKFITKQLLDAGYVLKEKDAFDVTDAWGNTVRYVFAGYDTKVENPQIFTKIFVTRFDKVHAQ